MEFDLAIAGDGVAARAALIALASSKLRIAVVAPSAAPDQPRIGEHLSPAAFAILEELQLAEEFRRADHLESWSTFSAWGTPHLREDNVSFATRGGGWSLDRQDFDDWLGRVAGERTDFTRFDSRVTDFTPDEGILQLDKKDEAQARFVLDASGRTGAATRFLARATRHDRMVAIFAVMDQIDGGIEPTRGIMTESIQDGWCYSALLPGRRLIAAYFTDADLLESRDDYDRLWRKFIEGSEFTNRRVVSAGFSLTRAVTRARVVDAGTRIAALFHGANWAVAGDAAAAFDPLSSHGITSALWSGVRAAQAARDALCGDHGTLTKYAEALSAGIAQFLQQRAGIYAAEQRYADRPFWSRRVHSATHSDHRIKP